MRDVKKVICEYCGQTISKSNYSKHLRRHENHPESFVLKYKLNHDGLTCQYCGKECKNRNSLCNHERQCKENPNRQVIERINFNNKGRVAGNKGLTKEIDERVAKGSETYRKNKLLGKHKDTTGDNNSSRKPGVSEKISLTCLKKSSTGDGHKSLAKNMHYNYNGVDLDGKWELYYAIYLDDNNIKGERCKDRFEYNWKDKIHYYTPDFYIPDEDMYIEIKGYKTDKDTCKWKDFPKDKKLIVLMYEDLKNLGIDVMG